MKNLSSKLTLVLTALMLSVWSGGAYAAKCTAPKSPDELTIEDLQAIYECIGPKLKEGYAGKGNDWAKAYPNWKGASSAPAAPGVHSGQYLMTFVNDVGFDQYIQYNSDNTEMPVGTIIAKEAFTIKKNKKIKKGPLLFMEKVGLDQAPNTGGWRYSGLKPNGKKLKVKEEGFCHACHQAYPQNDFLGYPVENVRVKG